jgi:hypothetical protein
MNWFGFVGDITTVMVVLVPMLYACYRSSMVVPNGNGKSNSLRSREIVSKKNNVEMPKPRTTLGNPYFSDQ